MEENPPCENKIVYFIFQNDGIVAAFTDKEEADRFFEDHKLRVDRVYAFAQPEYTYRPQLYICSATLDPPPEQWSDVASEHLYWAPPEIMNPTKFNSEEEKKTK